MQLWVVAVPEAHVEQIEHYASVVNCGRPITADVHPGEVANQIITAIIAKDRCNKVLANTTSSLHR